MRILVISNLYPPHHVGGYELACRDVVIALRTRGHDVFVLTSTWGVKRRSSSDGVCRCLPISLFAKTNKQAIPGLSSFRLTLILLAMRQWKTQYLFRYTLRTFRPDLIYIWNPTGLSSSLLIAAQQSTTPLCYLVSDHWVMHFKDNWGNYWAKIPSNSCKRFLKNVARICCQKVGIMTQAMPLYLSRVHFTSDYLLAEATRAEKSLGETEVIHWGIDTEALPFHNRESGCKPVRLLYVGQVVRHKGVHTAISAFGLLCSRFPCAPLTLDIVGGTVQPEYLDDLKGLTAQIGLTDHVHFHGAVKRERLPEIYGAHDILVFPSIWNEPFAITVLEAMASGLVVVGTSTGGSGEILKHGVNSLVFPPENAYACAAQIEALISDEQYYERLRHSARLTVEERFAFAPMVDRIESSLTRCAALCSFVVNDETSRI